MKRFIYSLVAVLVVCGNLAVAGTFNRPKGTVRFQELSQARQPLPSAELDNEFNTVSNWLNNSATFTQNISEWALYQPAVTYTSATTFTVAGDATDIFTIDRAISANLNGSYVYSGIASSSYDAGTAKTTVTLSDAVLTNALTQIHYGLISASGKSLPKTTAMGVITANDIKTKGPRVDSRVFSNASTAKVYAKANGLPLDINAPAGVSNLNLEGVEIGRVKEGSFSGVTVTGLKESRPEWFTANTIPGTTDMTAAIQAIITMGATVELHPNTTYAHTGLNLAANTEIIGSNSTLQNTADTNSLQWLGTNESRLQHLLIRGVNVLGNNGSAGSGIRIDYSVRYGIRPIVIRDSKISLNGEYGIYWTNGDSMLIEGSEISYNKGSGIYTFGYTNLTEIIACTIHHNTKHGVYFNQVASNSTVLGCQINDNGWSGVEAQRTEQPSILYSAFNRNGKDTGGTYPAVQLLGDVEKFVQAATVKGCIFGDNNTGGYDISTYYVQTANIEGNYFYGIDSTKPAYIRLSAGSFGINIIGNRWNTTAGTPAKVSVVDSTIVYSLSDIGDAQASRIVRQNSLGECNAFQVVSQSGGTLDLSNTTSSNVTVTTLTGNITSIIFPLNPVDGQKLTIRFKQAGAASRTVSGWPASVLLAGGTYTMTATFNKMDVIRFIYLSTLSQWLEDSRSQNL